MNKIKDILETIPAVKFRKNLGDFLNRVRLKRETFIIERDGKPLAAVISMYDLELMKEIAKEDTKSLFAKWENQNTNQDITEDEVEKMVVEETKLMRKSSK